MKRIASLLILVPGLISFTVCWADPYDGESPVYLGAKKAEKTKTIVPSSEKVTSTTSPIPKDTLLGLPAGSLSFDKKQARLGAAIEAYRVRLWNSSPKRLFKALDKNAVQEMVKLGILFPAEIPLLKPPTGMFWSVDVSCYPMRVELVHSPEVPTPLPSKVAVPAEKKVIAVSKTGNADLPAAKKAIVARKTGSGYDKSKESGRKKLQEEEDEQEQRDREEKDRRNREEKNRRDQEEKERREKNGFGYGPNLSGKYGFGNLINGTRY